jgi:hypothetical protein
MPIFVDALGELYVLIFIHDTPKLLLFNLETYITTQLTVGSQ